MYCELEFGVCGEDDDGDGDGGGGGAILDVVESVVDNVGLRRMDELDSRRDCVEVVAAQCFRSLILALICGLVDAAEEEGWW